MIDSFNQGKNHATFKKSLILEEGEDPYAETRIWGQYAIIQEVYNDTGTGEHGLLYKDPAGPGLGKVWTP